MELSWITFAIVCPLAGLAGFIDAIAGGGGLISLPAYLIAGLPPHIAIATNKLSSSMGTTVATMRYALGGFINWRFSLFAALFALAGSALGANLALMVDAFVLKVLMVIVLPLTAAYVMTHKAFGDSGQTSGPGPRAWKLIVPIAFAIGLYDGFYGPGTGTFLMLLLTGACRLTLREAAGTTKVINLTTNYAALAVFLFNGAALLPLGLAAGAFGILGNYLGAGAFIKRGTGFVRPVMLVVLAIFLIKVIGELVGVW